MPTGGVDTTAESIQSWRKAGVYSLGLGSKLFKEPSDSINPNWLSSRCQDLMQWALDY